MAETPDGKRYFCLARDVSKSGGAWGAPVRRYAIGLGCEMRHAGSLVYADGLDTSVNAQVNPLAFPAEFVSAAIATNAPYHRWSAIYRWIQICGASCPIKWGEATPSRRLSLIGRLQGTQAHIDRFKL